MKTETTIKRYRFLLGTERDPLPKVATPWDGYEPFNGPSQAECKAFRQLREMAEALFSSIWFLVYIDPRTGWPSPSAVKGIIECEDPPHDLKILIAAGLVEATEDGK